MRGFRKAAAAGVVLVFLALSTGVAHAHNPTPKGRQGCTPGFWKNNLLAWESTAPNVLRPGDKLQAVFDPVNIPDQYDNTTLLQALQFKGTEGTVAKLLRAAVAAMLNTTHFDVAYPLGDNEELEELLKTALAGSASDMEALKNRLDAWNNLGCPLRANFDY
jgi:hypothetical protein